MIVYKALILYRKCLKLEGVSGIIPVDWPYDVESRTELGKETLMYSHIDLY